jgi:predicted enzyme related to lactoylglutathione lyase
MYLRQPVNIPRVFSRPRPERKDEVSRARCGRTRVARWALVSLVLGLVLRIEPTLSENNTIPPISETVVMLYYKDIGPAAAFYSETLGLELTFDQDFAKLYRLTPTSVLGVILEGDTSYHKVQDTNAVMLSIVTPDVDAWYDRLQRLGTVKFLQPIADSSNNPIRAFLIEDPGGYTVEFFSWLKIEAPTE